MNEIVWNTTIHRRKDLTAREMDGEIVMADIQSGQFYGLGASARRIWELLDEPQSAAALCDLLMAEYDVPYEVCRQDVTEFLDELWKADLIRVEAYRP
jgi:hypothetical protein